MRCDITTDVNLINNCTEEALWWMSSHSYSCEKHKQEYLISRPDTIFISSELADRAFSFSGGLIIQPPHGRRITNIKME